MQTALVLRQLNMTPHTFIWRRPFANPFATQGPKKSSAV